MGSSWSYEGDTITINLYYLNRHQWKRHMESNKIPQNMRKIVYIPSRYHSNKSNKQLEPGMIPPFIETIELINYNGIILPNTFPDSVRKIIFKKNLIDYYEHQFEVGSLPNNLEEFVLPERYNQPFRVGSLPNNLEKLDLPIVYDQRLISNAIPNKVKTLIIRNKNYRYSLKDVIPNSVLKISFPNGYLKTFEMGEIPDSVIELYFGSINEANMYKKNKYKALVIPQSVQKITIDAKVYDAQFDDFNHYFTVYNLNNKLVKSAIE